MEYEFIETEFLIPWEDVFIPELVESCLTTLANYADWELEVQIAADAMLALDLINPN